MRRVCTLTLSLLLAAGCGGGSETTTQDEPSPAEGTAPAAGETEEASAAAPAAPPSACDEEVPEGAGPVVEDPSFELRADAGGPYAASTAERFQIHLTPRGNYHVNMEYPMNITVCGNEGVSVPDAPLERAAAREYTEERAAFDVPFTAAEDGEHRVTAVVDFAVCTPEACMPERRTLAVNLPVGGAAEEPAPAAGQAAEAGGESDET